MSAAFQTESPIGIVMLDTAFPRLMGDLGNPDSWPFPVRYRVVSGAAAMDVVGGQVDAAPFIAAAQALEAEGCVAITTSCGFLSLVQDEVKQCLTVPFVASSLMQCPLVEAGLSGGRRVGVLTISARALTATHLRAAGARVDTPIEGMDGSHFADVILNDGPEFDVAQCRSEMIAAGQRLRARRPDVGAVVLECTNMVPYAADVSRALGLPVFSIHSLICWVRAGVAL